MKQQIKNFLFKKRIKILKSKKGFSLIEVLVAVAIIGIISAIAVPQFTANRNEAARVAGDTSISNILKAFNNCLVLKSFAECNSLSALRVTCPDCEDERHPQSNPTKFCAHIAKGGTPANPDFAACVSIDTAPDPDTVHRSYGGTLLQGTICHSKQNQKGSCGGQTQAAAMSPVKRCSQKSECGTDQASGDVGANDCFTTYECKTGGTGKCNGSAVCG